MSARYELRERGVWDREMEWLVLPRTPEWDAYQAAVAAGDLPDPLPATPIDQVRTELRALVNIRRNAAIAAGVVFEGHTYDSDARSLANVTGAVAGVAAGIPLPEGFVWRSADNQNVPMDAMDLTALGAAMLAHGNACYAYSWGLKAAIDAAEDPATVDIDSGWPT